jgi:hypothetical protein
MYSLNSLTVFLNASAATAAEAGEDLPVRVDKKNYRSRSTEASSAIYQKRRTVTMRHLATFEIPNKIITNLKKLLLAYTPGGFCTNCMSLHYELLVSLSQIGKEHSITSIFDKHVFSPLATLQSLPVRYLFRAYSFLLDFDAQIACEESEGGVLLFVFMKLLDVIWHFFRLCCAVQSWDRQ